MKRLIMAVLVVILCMFSIACDNTPVIEAIGADSVSREKIIKSVINTDTLFTLASGDINGATSIAIDNLKQDVADTFISPLIDQVGEDVSLTELSDVIINRREDLIPLAVEKYLSRTDLESLMDVEKGKMAILAAAKELATQG